MWEQARKLHKLFHDPNGIRDLGFYELVTDFNRRGLHRFIIRSGLFRIPSPDLTPGGSFRAMSALGQNRTFRDLSLDVRFRGQSGRNSLGG